MSQVPLHDPGNVLRGFMVPPDTVDAHPDLSGRLRAIADRIEKYEYLAPYFFHPDSSVRAQAAQLCVGIDCGGINYFLVNALCDVDPKVGSSAAQSLWHRQGDSYCEHAVRSLRDEIRGFSSQDHAVNDLGPDQARQAVQRLVGAAPNASARAGIEKIVASELN